MAKMSRTKPKRWDEYAGVTPPTPKVQPVLNQPVPKAPPTPYVKPTMTLSPSAVPTGNVASRYNLERQNADRTTTYQTPQVTINTQGVPQQPLQNKEQIQVPEIDELKVQYLRQQDEQLAKDKQALMGGKLQPGGLVPARNFIAQKTFQSAAMVFDALKTALTMKQATKVLQLEQTFSDATGALENDIKLVKTGELSPMQAIINLEIASESLFDLEQTAKFEGKFNLRYWLDNGKEIQAKIIIQRSIIRRLRQDLENAILQSQMVQQEQQRQLRIRGGI